MPIIGGINTTEPDLDELIVLALRLLKGELAIEGEVTPPDGREYSGFGVYLRIVEH